MLQDDKIVRQTWNSRVILVDFVDLLAIAQIICC
jgi:hypothetical protein